jgi:hypothetical protein
MFDFAIVLVAEADDELRSFLAERPAAVHSAASWAPAAGSIRRLLAANGHPPASSRCAELAKYEVSGRGSRPDLR